MAQNLNATLCYNLTVLILIAMIIFIMANQLPALDGFRANLCRVKEGLIVLNLNI